MRAIIFSVVFFIMSGLWAQEGEKVLTLNQVIELAKEQSPDAILAKHRFKSSYWEYRSYKSSMLPSLTVGSQLVNFNNAINTNILDDGSEVFQHIQRNSSNIGLTIDQNVGVTGGNFFIYSGVERRDDFRDSINPTSFLSTPLTIGYSQPAFQFNPYKWQKKIEPLKYEEAKREYLFQLEQISGKAVNYFFNLSTAQLNVEINETNYQNNDTLFKIAEGRYNIGTIAENELLQLELAFLNSKSELAQSKINLEISKFRLRSFLGYNNKVNVILKLDTYVPDIKIPLESAINEAMKNNGQLISMERRLYEAERDVAKAKAENRFRANLYASYGLNQSAIVIDKAYQNPDNQQQVTFGVQVPILDWGEGKGKFRMAQSNQEVVKTRVKQEQVDFEQEVMLKVMQFNLQTDQLDIAAKSDTIARKRYQVAKQRFLIGKIDVLDLNVASSEKDIAQRKYLNAQNTYWNYYYNIRQYTLFDFELGLPLEASFEDFQK
ncbi:MAG: TolC family protein [Salinivirgaceae bacterium]|jgi:outer membrane protein TolC|nr:TolC family protein [Salinivirgaceae bacterium]